MSATFNPFGLRPEQHPSGIVRPDSLPNAMLSGYTSNIFQNSAVAQAATGVINIVGVTGNVIGSFQGVEYTPTGGGRRVVSNWWAANTTFNADGTQFTWITSDPYITYDIQADGSVALTTGLGNVGPLVAETGNTTTGFSTQALHASGLTNSGNNQLQVVGVWQDVNNAWGDAFTVVQVQIAQHQRVAARTGY